jgi:hypothetical protein
MSDCVGLKVFYWPRMDFICIEGFDDLTLYECPNVTLPHDKRKWLWTDLAGFEHELIEIGEM